MHHFQETTLFIYQNEGINQERGKCGVQRTGNTTQGRSKRNLQNHHCEADRQR